MIRADATKPHRAAGMPHHDDHLVEGERWPKGAGRWFLQAAPGLGTDRFSLFLCRDEAHAEDLALRCIEAGATEVNIECL